MLLVISLIDGGHIIVRHLTRNSESVFNYVTRDGEFGQVNTNAIMAITPFK